jgi:outer membrane murein-binding lipoprotein Lpp
MKMRGTLTIPRVLAAALGAFTLGACASRQAAESLSTRVENLEHRTAQHADTERRLAHIEAQSAQIIQLVEAMTSRLDSLDSRLVTLKAQQARATAPQRPLEPDPTVVYAVSVGDSPVEGSADAKITIVRRGNVGLFGMLVVGRLLKHPRGPPIVPSDCSACDLHVRNHSDGALGDFARAMAVRLFELLILTLQGLFDRTGTRESEIIDDQGGGTMRATDLPLSLAQA